MKNKLCADCQIYFDKICAELEHEAKKCKRGTLILDCLSDVIASIDDGDISRIVQRDNARLSGKNVSRRLKDK